MNSDATIPTQSANTSDTSDQAALADDVVAEDLIEEVSIDGMCGVY